MAKKTDLCPDLRTHIVKAHPRDKGYKVISKESLSLDQPYRVSSRSSKSEVKNTAKNLERCGKRHMVSSRVSRKI